MKLITFRINQKRGNLSDKLHAIRNLYYDVLFNDPYWHYFIDPEGATLRFQPKFFKKIETYIKKNINPKEFKFKKSGDYSPRRHEYYGVSFLGEDILPLFNELSVLCCKYPTYVILRPVHERLNHALMIMCGINSHYKEAQVYMNMAFGRENVSMIYDKTPPAFKLPRPIYRIFLWLNNKRRKNKKKFL